jgi:hypothetical protein
MAVKETLTRKGGSRKLLALDGGGIQGMLTIEVLAKIEEIVRSRTGIPDLVLGDWFDYVAGTSTGAIIATGIASGMSVEEIRNFYIEQGPVMFDKASLLKRLWYKYDAKKLERELRRVLGDAKSLGSEDLRCLLLLVLRNATTDSPWPISNNPAAVFNDRSRDDCNLDLPLWQLVRASAAAPVYFPPEHLKLGGKEFMFVDGAITSYNSPSFLLFLMATLPQYRLGWPTGPEKMLLVSVGTGHDPDASETRPGESPNIFRNAQRVPAALISAASAQQDLLCRALGRCVSGDPIDQEVGDLRYTVGDVGARRNLPELFTYARYNVELSRAGLDGIGVTDLDPRSVASVDAVGSMAELQRVGRALAAKRVEASHFDGFA